MIQEKECIYCKEVKPHSEFAKHPTRYDGLDGRCRECVRRRTKEVKEIRKTAPPMTEACECCGNKVNEDINYKQDKLCLDHDPSTNTFRGWLCKKCNLAIGLLGDDYDSVMRAIKYLERGKTINEQI
tara:strand:+ start:261 stop:641 length:381 start_codon:yes stop_codon:yes gene_type:complete